MKILITYLSQTGNTKKIADAMYDELKKAADTDIKSFDSASGDDFNNYDLVFVGSPCHAGDLSNAVKAFLGTMAKNPSCRIAGFITHAAPLYGKKDFEKCLVSFESIAETKNAQFIGFFHSQGFLSENLHQMIKESRNLDDKQWEEMVADMNGHPDDTDTARAREFAREIVSKVD